MVGVAFRRFWFIHHGHTKFSTNHSCILPNLVNLIIISGILENEYMRCSVLEYQLGKTKFSLAQGYSSCKCLLLGLDVYSTDVRIRVVHLSYLEIVSQVLDYSITSKYTIIILLVCNEVVEVIRKDHS
jgi:hypothetical protein